MIYNYLGIFSDQTSQMASCITYTVKHSLGEVEMVSEETIDGLLLANLLSRMSTGDTLLISEILQLGQRSMDVLNILSVLVQQGVNILSAKEGSIEPSLVGFINSIVFEIQSPTMESIKDRGQRMLLFG